MKKLVVILSLIFQVSFANEKEKIIVLKDVTEEVTVALNSETVRCSNIGYGSLELKVTVPDLVHITHFNHSNPGENAPCVTAGALTCRPGRLMPSNIVDPNNPTEKIQVRVILEQRFFINEFEDECQVSLHERVETTIRGVPFRHYREGALGTFPMALCKSMD